MLAGEYDFTDNLTGYLRAGQAETSNYVVGAGGGFTLLNSEGDTRMFDSLVRFKYKTYTVDGGLRRLKRRHAPKHVAGAHVRTRSASAF